LQCLRSHTVESGEGGPVVLDHLPSWWLIAGVPFRSVCRCVGRCFQWIPTVRRTAIIDSICLPTCWQQTGSSRPERSAVSPAVDIVYASHPRTADSRYLSFSVIFRWIQSVRRTAGRFQAFSILVTADRKWLPAVNLGTHNGRKPLDILTLEHRGGTKAAAHIFREYLCCPLELSIAHRRISSAIKAWWNDVEIFEISPCAHKSKWRTWNRKHLNLALHIENMWNFNGSTYFESNNIVGRMLVQDYVRVSEKSKMVGGLDWLIDCYSAHQHRKAVSAKKRCYIKFVDKYNCMWRNADWSASWHMSTKSYQWQWKCGCSLTSCPGPWWLGTGSRYEIAYISACTHDSNNIPTAIRMFSMSNNTTGLI